MKNYVFGKDHGRPYSIRDGNLLTLDQGVPAHQLAEEAGPVPEPPPKKGKGKGKKTAKANGVVAPIAPPEAQPNGDQMDIDQNGHTHVTNSVRADSEIAPSDAESPSVAELPISTLSLGRSTSVQTEGPKQLTKNTMFNYSVREPGKHVKLTSWGGTPKAPLLLVSGENILRLHLIGQKTENLNAHGGERILDICPLRDNYSVTARCWNSADEFTVSVQDITKNEQGMILNLNRLYKYYNSGQQYYILSPLAGKAHCLRWNAAKHQLLTLSFDGQNCHIRIFRDTGPKHFDLEMKYPVWFITVPQLLNDAQWISDSTFVVCGGKFFAIYQSSEDGFTCQTQYKTDLTWDELRYDATSGICAALGRSGPALGAPPEDEKYHLGIVHPSAPDSLEAHLYPDNYFCDLEFKSHQQTNGCSTSPNEKAPVLLATAAELGTTRVWDVNAADPFTCTKQVTMPDRGMAMKVAFSPNGRLLAVASVDMLAVWDTKIGGSWLDYKGKDKAPDPIAVWKASDCAEGTWDPNTGESFTIGWAPDSKSISMALNNQVCCTTPYSPHEIAGENGLDLVETFTDHLAQIAIIPV